MLFVETEDGTLVNLAQVTVIDVCGIRGAPYGFFTPDQGAWEYIRSKEATKNGEKIMAAFKKILEEAVRENRKGIISFSEVLEKASGQ